MDWLVSGNGAWREREKTDDEQHVGILSLHARCDARVFVTGEVLCIDNGDDRVEGEGTRRLALEFADLEREGGRKGRTAYAARKCDCEQR